jgi:hypothetical protein
MTAELLGDLPPARKAAVTSAVGLRPEPRLPLQITAQLAARGRARPGYSPRWDCPALDTLFLATPVANKGSLTQYIGRILRAHENKTTAEVHDYLDERTGVLAAMLAKLAPGYTGLGFPDPAGSHSLQAPTEGTAPGPAGRSEIRIQYIFDPGGTRSSW